ncbi:MAG: hypothetical protein M3R68_10355, partial [Acidobacteriota bacterium]|nr:hypothetical protein [Acidobacteriota bacterium]
QQDRADRILQGGGADTVEIVNKTMALLKGKLNLTSVELGNDCPDDNGRAFHLPFLPPRPGQDKKCLAEERKYVNLDPFAVASDQQQTTMRDGASSDKLTSILRNRAVRTIDIIPRQSAVNVNDTKERVSKTGIFAAISFLFGFAGKFSYQRQREQAQQFLNQELFTSGFGKGEMDFGWNFYPFAGSKQLAPGIRTTYAVAIIPEDAESVVLKAKGCYFPRKQNQPLNYDVASSENWLTGSEKESNCTDQEQVFVVPVPGGSGDGADYYVTGMWFAPNRKPGDRIVASIYGQNFPTQVGILVNGAPLTESVGLGQIAIESVLGDRVKENCVGPICGRFERVDANQIVMTFTMGPDFKNTPLIAVIGPGKEIELNKLNLNINGKEDVQLATEWMFGSPPTEASRTIEDLRVAPAATPNQMTGVLSGGKFKPSDTIFVNGSVAKAKGTPCQRPDLCILSFAAQETDFLSVTVAPEDKEEEAVSRTFVNPSSLSIISATVVSSEEGDATHPSVLVVKLDGSGFKSALLAKANDVDIPEDKKLVTSPGQMILKLVSPERVTQISLKDRNNNKVVSTVVVKPDPPPKDKDK